MHLKAGAFIELAYVRTDSGPGCTFVAVAAANDRLPLTRKLPTADCSLSQVNLGRFQRENGRNYPMRCRPFPPKGARCAVGSDRQKVHDPLAEKHITMRCRFAPTFSMNMTGLLRRAAFTCGWGKPVAGLSADSGSGLADRWSADCGLRLGRSG